MSDKIERLGNFVLLERLNKGGMAEVYLAKSVGANGVNKFLAIKRILPEHAQRKEFIEMFKEEAKIAVNLNHQNVISAIDYKVENNQGYLVMDYMQGKNLREILVEKAKKDLKLLIPYIVHIIKETAAGLDYAHNSVDRTTGMPLNLIHRDMSPQNIMISYQGEVKVIDFGIAKAEKSDGESTQAGTLKGKYSYMSPEQAEGGNIDKTTDIFALGIILWELLADERLFQANNEINILKRVKECDVPELRKANPSIPLELDKITKKCLAKEKSFRYASAADLYKDLARYLAREYPDFVPKDFGTFIQGLFTEDFEKMQRKLKEFSKLKVEGGNEDNQKTEVVSAAITTTEKIEEGPQGMEDIDSQPVELNLAKELKKSRMNGFSDPTRTGATRGTSSGTKSRIPRADTVTRSPNPYKKKKPKPSTFNLNFLMILVVAIASGYFLVPAKLINKLMGKKSAVVAQTKPAAGPTDPEVDPLQVPAPPPMETASTETNTTDMATQGSAVIMVESKPERAEIYLDGKPLELVTPARITVPINTEFELTLTKEGHLTYSNRFKAPADGKVSVALQPVPVGYLFINVNGLTAGAKIKVNGVNLPDRPPIKRYPVAANTPIKIEVEDALTSAYATRTVTVRPEQKEEVTLSLVPGKGKPTGNVNE